MLESYSKVHFGSLSMPYLKSCQSDTADWKLTNALLSERETLCMEGKELAIREDTLFNPLEGR